MPRALSEKLLTSARAELERERERLADTLVELEQTGQVGAWRDSRADVVDAGAAAVEREQSQALWARQQRRLTDVEDALRRLDDGTYGNCQVCGERIGAERLRALPATKYCLEHSGG